MLLVSLVVVPGVFLFWDRSRGSVITLLVSSGFGVSFGRRSFKNRLVKNARSQERWSVVLFLSTQHKSVFEQRLAGPPFLLDQPHRRSLSSIL